MFYLNLNPVSNSNATLKNNQPITVGNGRINEITPPCKVHTTEFLSNYGLETPPIDIGDIISKCNEILEKYGSYLNPDKIYNIGDSEWGNQPDINFGEWLQSCNTLFFCRETGWDYQIFMFHSTNLPHANYIINSFSNPKIIHTLVPDIKQTTQLDTIYNWLDVNNLVDENVTEEIVMKYSPLDMTAYLGVDKWVGLLVDKMVEQKRCIKFNFKLKNFVKKKISLHSTNRKFLSSIRDIHGLNSISLSKQASSVGVKLLAKNSMDEYKTDMFTGYAKKPRTATVYNIADVLGTFETMLAYIPLLNKFAETMNISDYLEFDADNLPYTGGSMVAKLIDTLIEYAPKVIADLPVEYRQELFDKGLVADYTTFTCSDEELLIYRLALRRFPEQALNISKGDIKLYNQVVYKMSLCNSLEDYENTTITTYLKETGKKEEVSLSYFLLSDKWKYITSHDNRGQCSAKAFGIDTLTTLPFQAITQGGRCHNSKPSDYRAVGLIGDSDMPSAYVSKMRTLELPLGLPTTLQKNRNDVGTEKDRLFSKVIKKLNRKGELRGDLWVADVSTSDILDSDQDLLYSSLDVTAQKINKCVTGINIDDVSSEKDKEPDDIKKIPSLMSLEINRLVHSKITSTSYEVINKVLSNKELSVFNSKVYYESFVYFANSSRYENPIEWAKEILKSPISKTADKNGTVIDKRTRAYFPFPLEIFIGKLADERRGIKRHMKQLPKGDVNRDKLNTIQNFYKLVCNTAYGVFASVYFNLSNSLVANNITDGIRTNMWLKSKALRTYQEITDGGWYDLLNVAYFSGRKPTMHTFSKWERWRNSSDGKTKMWTGVIPGFTRESLTEHFNVYVDINNQLKKAYELNDKSEIARLSCVKYKWESDMDSSQEQFIVDFWKPYDIKYTAGVEHKTNHYAWKAAYNGKGNYIFDSITEGVLNPSRRGARYLSQEQLVQGYKDNPALLELVELLKYGEYREFNNPGYDVFNLVKLGEWMNAPSDSDIRKQLPGQARIAHREPRQINNAHVRMTSTKSKKGKVTHLSDTIYNRKTEIKGVRTEMFSRYVSDGADVLYRKMNDNDLDPTKLEFR